MKLAFDLASSQVVAACSDYRPYRDPALRDWEGQPVVLRTNWYDVPRLAAWGAPDPDIKLIFDTALGMIGPKLAISQVTLGGRPGIDPIYRVTTHRNGLVYQGRFLLGEGDDVVHTVIHDGADTDPLIIHRMVATRLLRSSGQWQIVPEERYYLESEPG